MHIQMLPVFTGANKIRMEELKRKHPRKSILCIGPYVRDLGVGNAPFEFLHPQDNFKFLNGIAEWRRVLDDSYIHLNAKNEIMPLTVYGEDFASVVHAKFYYMFIRDYSTAKKFKLNGEVGKDATSAKKLGNMMKKKFPLLVFDERGARTHALITKFRDFVQERIILHSTIDAALVRRIYNGKSFSYKNDWLLIVIRELICWDGDSLEYVPKTKHYDA